MLILCIVSVCIYQVRENTPVSTITKCLPRVNVFLRDILDNDSAELLSGYVVRTYFG